ncbi:hypothetical protein KKG90_00640 [Candidatus Bipolaricaulota bacterium]|nr:hypothetical protein [Candidatus Bipolaricaulota bacterium]
MKELAGLRNCTQHRNTRAIVVGLTTILVWVTAGLACFAGWSDLPDNLHAVMPILHHEPVENSAATVLLMDSCEMAFRNLYRNSHWTTDEVTSYWERIQATCNEKWGSTSHVLYLMVVPTIGREGEAAWWPWNLIVTQDKHSYAISLSDSIVGLSKAFQGRVFSTMDGLIRIPDQIDVRRPFQINYAITEVTIGPF